MEGFLDELRALADEEREAAKQRDAAIQAAHDRHAEAMRVADAAYMTTSPERHRRMGALIFRAVDEGARAADVAKALGISTRGAQAQLRYYGEMSADFRARYGAPPSPEQRPGQPQVVSE